MRTHLKTLVWLCAMTCGPVGVWPQDTGLTKDKVAGEPGKVIECVYKKTPQGELKMLIHFPADWKASDKRPGIVFFFGGGWRSGTPAQFEPQATYLATRGMVAARPEYRIQSKHNTTPDKAVEDGKSAIRWFRAHAAELGVDPQRIVGSGGSAGGHLAACAAMLDSLDADGEDAAISSKPNALVLFNPVVDMRGLGVKSGETRRKDLTAQLSPILGMKKETPPAILFYGTSDKFCEQGRAFLARSKELGNRVELFVAEGMPHGFFNKSPWTEVTLKQADLFLVSLGYLTGEPTIAIPSDAPSLKQER
ncbi:MAG: alpha/beta hydrolase [Candidatus Sumerlaeia bacterium]|nr:alpha/beta hydrolase [Candidatus Sumerlaeia bacterium]